MGRALVFALIAALVFVATGVTWFAVQWFVFGDTECDRGKCGPMGEFTESVGFPGLFVIWAALGAVVGWAVAVRRATRNHERPRS